MRDVVTFNTGLGYGLVPDGTKPLPKPILKVTPSLIGWAQTQNQPLICSISVSNNQKKKWSVG